MFTGIIQGTGKINSEIFSLTSGQIEIITDLNLSNCQIGSSISCDGICLTITEIINSNDKYLFKVNVGEETLKRTTLQFWNNESIINLEKSLKVGDEISGHFVYGHVDNIAEVKKIDKLEFSWNFSFSTSTFTKEQSKFIVEKGSVSINGVSLTIAKINNISKEKSFDISVIPHTYTSTNLSNLDERSAVNVEFDILARYIIQNNE